MKAVYDAISTLKFIEDPELFIPSNSGLGIKDIKEFVELMLAKYKNNCYNWVRSEVRD